MLKEEIKKKIKKVKKNKQKPTWVNMSNPQSNCDIRVPHWRQIK